MREIKFRAWDKIGKKMVDLHKITPLALVPGINKSGKGLYLPLGEEERLIFEQFTGLKDKNGKEIYEGDKMRRNTGYEYVVKLKWYSIGPSCRVWGYEIDKDDEIICSIHDKEKP